MGLFALREVNIRYDGYDVLKDISLRIDKGERVSLVGKSGAGKSTLLKLFYQQQRAETALVPQELGLVKLLSVFHNVYIGRLHRHGSWYNLTNPQAKSPISRHRSSVVISKSANGRHPSAMATKTRLDLTSGEDGGWICRPLVLVEKVEIRGLQTGSRLIHDNSAVFETHDSLSVGQG